MLEGAAATYADTANGRINGMKKQIFTDGNKRTGIIFANHYLISKSNGLLVVPYYEDNEKEQIYSFLKTKCWKYLK